MKTNCQHYDSIIASVQKMEDIGGPDSLEEYIDILERVKQEIERRITTAKEIVSELRTDIKPFKG